MKNIPSLKFELVATDESEMRNYIENISSIGIKIYEIKSEVYVELDHISDVEKIAKLLDHDLIFDFKHSLIPTIEIYNAYREG